jgi:hypothetical protein
LLILDMIAADPVLVQSRCARSSCCASARWVSALMLLRTDAGLSRTP